MLLALDFWYKGKHLEKGGCKAAFLAVSPNQIFADGGGARPSGPLFPAPKSGRACDRFCRPH
jgi:hypothetical protein